MKFSETAAEVIELATRIRDYWNTELPKRHRDYPIVSPGEDSGPAPAEEAELRSFLEGLSDEEIYKLVLVKHLGRGDFGTEELGRNYLALKQKFQKRDRAMAQIDGKAALADYLSDGVEELEKSGVDLDELPLAPVRSRN